MRLRHYAGIILISFMLFSCASTRMAQELQVGKIAFQSGQYKEAFHSLLPLAAQGKSDAQYAVGYMYYYGYGVAEDSESGVFWMNKAAELNYTPAVAALKLLHEKNNAEANSTNSLTHVARQDEVLHAIPTEAAPKSMHHYTLQLYGSYQLAAAKKVQMQLNLKNTGHIYRTVNKRKDWYILTFGNFSTAHKAAATKNNLPEKLKKLRPWARNIDTLKML